jgi:hypothetical protein
MTNSTSITANNRPASEPRRPISTTITSMACSMLSVMAEVATGATRTRSRGGQAKRTERPGRVALHLVMPARERRMVLRDHRGRESGACRYALPRRLSRLPCSAPRPAETKRADGVPRSSAAPPQQWALTRFAPLQVGVAVSCQDGRLSLIQPRPGPVNRYRSGSGSQERKARPVTSRGAWWRRRPTRCVRRFLGRVANRR